MASGIDCLESVLRLARSQLRAHQGRAWRICLGQPEDALKTIDDAMARLGIKTEWLLRKADVLESMGRQTRRAPSAKQRWRRRIAC